MTEPGVVNGGNLGPQPIQSCDRGWYVLSGVLSFALIVIGILGQTRVIAQIPSTLPGIFIAVGLIGFVLSCLCGNKKKSEARHTPPNPLPPNPLPPNPPPANPPVLQNPVGPPAKPAPQKEAPKAVVPKSSSQVVEKTPEPSSLSYPQFRKSTRNNVVLTALSNGLIPLNGTALLNELKEELSKIDRLSLKLLHGGNKFLEILKKSELSEEIFKEPDSIIGCLVCKILLDKEEANFTPHRGEIERCYDILRWIVRNPALADLSQRVKNGDADLIYNVMLKFRQDFRRIVGREPEFRNVSSISGMMTQRWKDGRLLHAFTNRVYSERDNERVLDHNTKEEIFRNIDNRFKDLFTKMKIDPKMMTKKEIALALTKTDLFLDQDIFWGLLNGLDCSFWIIFRISSKSLTTKDEACSYKDLLSEAVYILFNGQIDDSNIIAADVLSILIFHL